MAEENNKVPGTVIIGCKLANGFVMELIESPEFKQGLIPREAGERVVIHGANTVSTQSLNPLQLPFGRTTVRAAFAAEWFKRNKDLPMVKNGLVFQIGDKASFADIAKERAALETKLEPLNPAEDLEAGVEADKDQLARLTKGGGRRPVILEEA